jgi:hypothetical protein
VGQVFLPELERRIRFSVGFGTMLS